MCNWFHHDHHGRRGRRQLYSDQTICTLLMLKVMFSLTLRTTTRLPVRVNERAAVRAVITRPMALRVCSTNCPAVKGLIPTGLRLRFSHPRLPPHQTNPWPTAGRARTGSTRYQRLCGGVRGVWQRHDLLSKHDRLLRLEKNHREQAIELSDEQIRLLERFSPEFRERQIEVHYTGELVVVDTFFVGALEGVGKVYLQTVLDCYNRHAWVRLYTSKLPVTSVHVLNETVLPFFEAHEARAYTMSDNGREFCGRPDHHPYKLFLQLEGIEHRTTKVRRPQSNGFIERQHRALLDEHFRIKGRTTWYESVEQMQTDLDSYQEHYNTERPHQGRMMEGQTPYCMFKKGLKLIPKEVRTKVA